MTATKKFNENYLFFRSQLTGLESLTIFKLKGNKLAFINQETFKFLNNQLNFLLQKENIHLLNSHSNYLMYGNKPLANVKLLDLSHNKIQQNVSDWIINHLIKDSQITDVSILKLNTCVSYTILAKPFQTFLCNSFLFSSLRVTILH